MGKLQPRSEFDVTKALKIPGAGGKSVSESANEHVRFEPVSTLYSSNHTVASADLPCGEVGQFDSRVPDWCYPAFQFEKGKSKRERTDWDFVLPVWIAITLFCMLVQVVGLKTLAALM